MQDNEATWLEHSDLVFVDPVGTGFSRPTRAEYGAEFYNTLGDIASIAEFVRVYLTRFDAWDAPLFVAGESYGAWRASGVAETLEQQGTRVAGVMLISGGIHVGPVIDDDMRTALFIPTRAAAAFHHQKLSADLQKDLPATLRQIEEWARTEYAPALKRVARLTDQERDAIVGHARALHRSRSEPHRPADAHRRPAAIRRAAASRSETRAGALRHARRRGTGASRAIVRPR